MRVTIIFLLSLFVLFGSCSRKNAGKETGQGDSARISATNPARLPEMPAFEVRIERQLLYDRYTLDSVYPYRDTVRRFQWDKIEAGLRKVDSLQSRPARWAVLQNRKNLNGEAPLTHRYVRNAYKHVSDTLGTERYQGTPLYLPSDPAVPEIYGQDGSLVELLRDGEDTVTVRTAYAGGEWLTPRRYVREIPDSVRFRKVIFVDRTNQNIATFEKGDSVWKVRSMNPATTGLHHPPYQQETPLGIFVIQEKKSRMVFLVDGTTVKGGFAPWASRFSNGGYIHGVPVNEPRQALIEYSPSLGTTPRSHMCVRNATSHAKFVYDWAPVWNTLVFVIE